MIVQWVHFLLLHTISNYYLILWIISQIRIQKLGLDSNIDVLKYQIVKPSQISFYLIPLLYVLIIKY